MKKKLTYIAPLKAGIILAILYGIVSLLFIPFVVIGAVAATGMNAPGITPTANVLRAGFAILLPVLYAIVGFVSGIIVAALYNLIAKWTGGFEFEVRDVPLA